jgi:NTP pyrophosphatase (non-canonical NTP hydrolase)
MLYKLKVHHRKGRWEDLDLRQVLSKLHGEVEELKQAVALGNHVEITLEAADVANYALIASSIAMERGK